MAGKKKDIESLLDKLHDFSPGTDQCNARYAKDIIVDISEHLSVDLSPVQYDLYLSQIFGPKGITEFGLKVLERGDFVDAKSSTLDLIITLLKKDTRKITKYVGDVTKYTLSFYNAEKSTKVCAVALEAFCLLLEKYSTEVSTCNINLHRFIEGICVQLQSVKGHGVLYNQLRILGMLAKVYPEKVRNQSNLILRLYKDHLAKHMGNKPNLVALAGVLRGLTLYLYNFPEGDHDDPELYKTLYKRIHMVLNPNLNFNRRDAQRAALELIHVHGDKFSEELYHHYDSVFPWLVTWCSSRNRDDYKAAVPAMDTFVTVMSMQLQLQSADDMKAKEIFKYFLQEYNKLLETGNSSSKISLAVKGYGSLSGACLLLLSPQEVHTMFLEVLSASHHAFYKSNEMLEDRLSSLPSYIESLADIIRNMTTISIGIVENVQQMALALVENLPSVSMYRLFLAYRALFKLFFVMRGKAEYFQDFIHSFVYKSIIHTCSHPPEIEPLEKDGEFWKKSPQKWEGVKDEAVTYRSYLPLWKALMMPEKVGSMKVPGMSAPVLTEISSILYTEYITSTLEIVEKLDLTTSRQEELETNDGNDDEVTTSDPIAGVNARTPKDFQVYMNVVALMEEVLPLQYRDQLQPHVNRLCWFFIRCSSQQPLVSAHYSSLTAVLTCTQKMCYFEKKEEPEIETLVHLLGSYVGEVLQRCRQFRDQLLASCLTLIFRLPLCIVTEIFPKLISPLQMALQLGVSYLPLAEVCIAALHAWTRTLPHDTLHQHLPAVLPLLLPYLCSQETGEAEVETRIITVKMAMANQRRKIDKKKVLAGKQVDDTAMKKVQLSILQLIGGLNPSLGQYVIPQDPDSLAAATVRWDCQKHIRFALPFNQTKIDIHLDDLLPRVVDLALNSSDRQTKVAASELLHSTIIVMIGIGSQQQREVQEGDSMALLYHHIFKAMLQLACDPDQVTRQLFATLAFQTIHWFTNNTNYENPDTAVLLEAIMSGIVTANNPALRDISAQCLAEFVKWSRKQSRGRDSASLNIKSILKRIFSLCKHPSAFKRLGGCLAWNSIYREVREDATAVDIWALEILNHLMLALNLAQADDPALGTHEQTKQAILHMKRILVVKNELFWKNSSKRRTPVDFEGGTFEDVLVWLLKQSGSPKTLVRHTCMELLETLAPHAKNCTSIHAFVGRQLQQPDSAEQLVHIIEGGGQSGLGILDHAQPSTLKIFLESLLAALDGYSWLIGKGIVQAERLLKCKKSKIFQASSFFLKYMAVSSLPDYLKNTANVSEGETLKTPLEYETLTKMKCTVVVRLLDFIAVLLVDGAQSVNLLGEFSIWTDDLYQLVLQCALDPASVGFDIRDTEVTKHLPSRLEEVLNVMRVKVPGPVSEAFIQFLQKFLEDSSHFDAVKIFKSPLAGPVDVSLKNQHGIEGLRILQKSGWLRKCLEVLGVSASEMVGWVCGSLFSGQGTELTAVSPRPAHLPFLWAVLDLAVALDYGVQQLLVKQVTDMELVRVGSRQQIQKGFHLLNILGPKIIPHILPCCDLVLTTLLDLITDGNFLDVMCFSGILLSTLTRNADLRKKYSEKVVQAFLHHWSVFSAEAGKSSMYQESVLDLLSSLFIVDRAGLVKKQCQHHDSGILSFYQSLLLEDNTPLSIRNKALKLLPFFLTMSPQVSESICENLLILKHLPLQSSDFPAGGARDRDHQQTLTEMLTALELSLSLQLLVCIVKLYCREDKHRYDELFRESLEKFIKQQPVSKQLECLKCVYDMFANPSNVSQSMRYNIMDKALIPFLQLADMSATVSFYLEFIKPVMAGMSVVIYGTSQEQLSLLVTKTGNFKMLQVMFSRLPREKVFHPGSEISAAYKPGDAMWKEMTKVVLLESRKASKGDLKHDATQAEFRRLCACAAYNTTIAVLVCVKDELKFYTDFLFYENPARREVIWDSLIDCSKTFQFDIEVDFNPSRKRRFVTVRRELEKDNQSSAAGTVQYLASHYLDDSSLREDVSQFDFSNSVVLAMSQKEGSQQRITSAKAGTGELQTMVLEQNDFNDHEVMANLTATVYHLVDAKIMELYQGDMAPPIAVVPSWMTLILQKLDNRETHRNVKLFLLRLMMNTASVFAPYAVHFIMPVLSCLVDGTTGDRINYFFCDLVVMVLGWGKKVISQDSTYARATASKVLEFLCSNTPHNRADVFKYNIDVVRSVVECWKTLITVPYGVIYSFMEVKDGRQREQEASLHLLGIMLANNIAPYTEGCQAEKTRCEKLLLRLLDAHYASVYGAAAEVVGLVLKYQGTHLEEPQDTSWQNSVVSKLMDVLISNEGQGITAIYKIHLHFPAIISKFFNKFLSALPRLYGIFRTRVLECLVSHLSSVEDVFSYLKEQNILGLMEKREESTQLVCLELVNSVLPCLSASQLLYFLPEVTAFSSHPSAKCRENMYKILFWVYNHWKAELESEGKPIEVMARVSLLQAMREKDAALKQSVFNFWLEQFKSLSPPERVLRILQKVYSPESEESFLELAMYILLEETRYSADYQRDIFQHPLTVCKFREMRVSTAWRARHASMIPLFMESQSSSDASLRSLTQGTESEDDTDAPRGVEATQSKVFSATQQTGATFNWVTESTFNTLAADKEYEATHAPVQTSAAQPMFTVGTSDSGQPQSKLIRRRFVKEQDREKQHLYFAKLEERRSKMRATLEKERKSRREAQVTLYRQYRVGELPDIQIPHRAVIAPLQALSQRDDKVAQMLFSAVVQGVVDNAPTFLSPGENDMWKQEIRESLNTIISESYTSHPDVLRALLHIVIDNDIPVDPKALATACHSGHLEALGILVLERQVLVSQREQERNLSPPAKRQRTTVQIARPDTSAWISIAELYKSLGMWDVVRGVVHGGLSRIKPETKEALEAEASNDYVEAFTLYRRALSKHWDEEPEQAEIQLWEESYASCAAMLGQWSELEGFLQTRILHDEAGQPSLDCVWTLPRPTVSVLPSIVNSKLMNILDGSESDNNLFAFVNAALGEPEKQVMLENTLPLQLAVMSVHQQKIPQARHYVTVATSKALLTLAQSSLVITKPVIGTIRDIQLITEFEEFLKTLDHADCDNYPTKVRQTVRNWRNQATSVTDSSFLMQSLSSYRDLYFHFLEKELPQDCLQDIQLLIKDTKASLHKSVINTALKNKNYHLASRHLKKLKPLCENEKALAQVYFFMTEITVQRSHSRHQNPLQALVQGWSKCLGKVHAMASIQQDVATQIELLKLESSLSMEVVEAIRAMGDSWDEDDECIKTLFNRLPNAREKSGLYRELLRLSYENLQTAKEHADQLNTVNEGVKDQGKDMYMTLAKYCDNCLEKWKEHVDTVEYAESLVVSVLRAMALGSHEAHFYFPRLINLMNENPNLVEVFKKQAGSVPVWMYLLWINLILVYADKSPSAALQPIIEELAKEYPQAVVYPFRISKQQYNFTGDVGRTARAMCERVESLLCKNSLLHHFATAMSFIVVPSVALKESFNKLSRLTEKTDIEIGLKNIITNYLQVNNRSKRGLPEERGEAFCKDGKLVKNVDAALTKVFGKNLANFEKMSVEDIKSKVKYTRTVMNQDSKEKIPIQLKTYSPWLANFQASKHSDSLEIPGQYSGMSKPLPAYHVNISSFDDHVVPMKSLRVPIRIVIRGSDEKDHKYLVKWGEDLRTDQRMQQVFTLMNSLYSTSPLCAHTSFLPSLDTYQIVPLSLEVGILKWVESTQPLMEFIKSSFREGEAKCYEEAKELYKKGGSWELGRKQVEDKGVVKRYVDIVNKIPWDILRRGLVRLSNSSEGFFSLRSVFANSYATMCVSHWLLGVGDRHCGNTLISLKTGRAVGIDFGHHFESSVQFLPVPELMPLRLTPQIVNVFQPLGHASMMKDVMVAVLGALQESRHVLLAMLETFVREPTKDWLEFVRIQEGDLAGSVVEVFSEERIRCLKGKLSGLNPAHITVWALSKNKSASKDSTVLSGLKEIVLGTTSETTRAGMGKDGLTVHQQVDALLEQATDPKILGRTWLGWEPYL
ncbi:DNA-dependent protein kinase catalytic subunit-like isoform X2 [Eriocheir sinensis]|uniref:DNA-dependent protein kinase catalytic subunit-like isoform X2 n=1 Tax=Eriocheir sinensis TaxID=95602 RepID=UPI0021C78534|nr:DNA-dependent protein kinase catalytic subunit-like isoform X2 [Eriocheir sinensis]